MKWNELKGQYLKGIMETKKGIDGDNYGVYLFLRNKTIAILSDNQNYSSYTTWRIQEIEDEPLRDDKYKTIGETIQEIWTDDYDTDAEIIDNDFNKWKNFSKDNEDNYYFVKIKTITKEIAFGGEYWDDYYPGTIWNVI